jgi:SynChlorMet cassette radical SAM/SPASM protein ScmF
MVLKIIHLPKVAIKNLLSKAVFYLNNKGKSMLQKTPPLKTIYFYLSEGCNLKCRHCWIEPKFQNENKECAYLSLNQFKHIVEQGKELGLEGVKLTGGEPFVNPEIFDILDYLSNENLTLSIETNGVKCTREMVEKIARCHQPFVSVSLDGADADTHEWVRNVDGCFNAALDGIRNLVKANIESQIIMSIMRHNHHQIEKIINLAENEGIRSIKFNIVAPTSFRGKQMHETDQALPIEELLKLGSRVENILQPKTKVKLLYSHPLAFKPLNKIFTSPVGRCGVFNIIGVLGNGKYALCGIGQTVQELIFGDSQKDRLEHVWTNNEVIKEIRENIPGRLKGICGECLLNKMCSASCLAANYYRERDLFASNWYCDEANKAGAFPATRKKSTLNFK